MRPHTSADLLGSALRKSAILVQPRPQRRTFLVASIVFPMCIAVASYLDGTWTMPGSAKGFAQYYGFWAIFVTTPFLLALTSGLFTAFTELIGTPEQYCTNLTDETRDRLQRLVRRHIRSLSLHAPTAWILVFIMLVMLYWWIFNVIGTIWPTPLHTFHHDVFDSSAHPFGYYVTRCYTFFVFVLVDAPAVFLALHVTASMISILKFVCQHDVLHIDFFHADNCGGTSQFGNINLRILGMFGAFFAIIYAMYLTHRHTYLVMVVALTACSVLAIMQSVAAVYYIHKAVAQKRRRCIDALAARLNEHVGASLRDERFPNDLLALRNHLLGLHTFPYAGGSLVAVNIIRFAPALLAVIGFFRRA